MTPPDTADTAALELDACRALLAATIAERDELRATLDNDAGRGEPPGDGWYRNDFDPENVGIAWHRHVEGDGPGHRDEGGPRGGEVVLWVHRGDRADDEHRDEWAWTVERYDAGADRYDEVASGFAPTARAAMRDADAAAGRGA